MKKIIKNGHIIIGDQVFKGDLLLENGIISDIGANLSASNCTIYDATDCYVLPGAVDFATNLAIGADGKKSKEVFSKASIAAAFGGTTTIVEKPSTQINEPAQVIEEYKELSKDSYVNYSFHQACINQVNDEYLEKNKSILTNGFPSTYTNMAYAGKINDEDLLKLMQNICPLGAYVLVEADSYVPLTLTRYLHEAKGRFVPYALPSSHPTFTEVEAALRVCNLIRVGSFGVLALNISSYEALKIYAETQGSGLPCMLSTSLPYLFLDLELYRDGTHDGYEYITYPPLRTKQDNEELIKALMSGVLNIVSSNHTAYSLAYKKEIANGNAFNAPAGMPGVELRLPLLFTELVNKRKMPLTRLAEITSTHVTRIMGLRDKGRIEKGVDADIVVIDPKDERIINLKDLHENCDYTPYAGMKLCGFARHTFVGGEAVIANKQFVADKITGKLTFRKAVSVR